MRRYFSGVFRDGSGNVIQSGTISVYLTGTNTAASVYTSVTSATAVNSVTSDSTDGSFEFYTNDFDYGSAQGFDIIMTKSGYVSKTYYNIDTKPVIQAYTISADTTLGATIYLDIPYGVTYSIASGKTLTIYSPANINASPEQQIVTGSGVLRFTVPDEIHVGWFGAKGDDPGDGTGTNDATALLAAIDCARATHGGVGTMGATLSGIEGRTYLSESALFVGGNTATSNKWVYKLKNLTIYGKHTGYVIDYTGAHGKELENVHIIGDSSTKPKVGVFFARASTSAAGQHIFSGKNTISGHVSICGLANYSSEEGTYENVHVRVSSGISAVIFTDTGYYYSAELAAYAQFPQTNMDSDPGKISDITHKFRRSRFEHIGSGEAEYDSHVQLIGADQWDAMGCYFGSAAGGDATTIYVKLRTDSARSGSNPNYPRITNSLFHAEYKQAVQFVNGTVVNPIIKGNTYGGTGATDADIMAGSASVILYDADIEATSLDFSAATCDILNASTLKIGLGSSAGSVNISQRFHGDLYVRSTTTLTLGGAATYLKGTVHEVDTGKVYPLIPTFNFKTRTTNLGAGNITLTAAALIGGYIFEDPEGNANWTTATATELLAVMPHARIGSTFTCYLYNGATAASGEVVTLLGGEGVTLRGTTTTLTQGTNVTAMLVFVVVAIDTPTFDCLVITN